MEEKLKSAEAQEGKAEAQEPKSRKTKRTRVKKEVADTPKTNVPKEEPIKRAANTILVEVQVWQKGKGYTSKGVRELSLAAFTMLFVHNNKPEVKRRLIPQEPIPERFRGIIEQQCPECLGLARKAGCKDC